MSLKVKKGSNVIMKGFTGIKLGVFPVDEVTETGIVIVKKNGEKAIFSKKTGKQTNAKNAQYANCIIEDDGSYVAPQRGGKAKSAAPAAKSKKAKAAEPEEDEEDEDNADEDEDEDEVPESKPAKKSKGHAKVADNVPAKATKGKKKAKPAADDDEYEEVE